MKYILIRYGELTLKGKNRKEFERILFNNIQKQTKGLVEKYKKDHNRIYLEILDYNSEEIFKILKKIPGIHSFGCANQIKNDLDEIKKEALNIFNDELETFKVETKRINKNYPLVSNDVSRQVGAHILINKNTNNLKVDVKTPKQKIKIEIHDEHAYVFGEYQKGMGGLPIGSSGRGVLLLSGGIDSPVAGIMAMKRGLKIQCIHFSSPPYTSQESLNKVKDLVKVLQQFDKDIKLYDVGFTDVQLNIHEKCISKYEVTILRRMMLKKATELANRIKVKVLITGESLGQVASQTIDSMYVTNQATDKLILRPLITMDKLEIIEIAKEYKTFEISTLPYEDCCVVFLPKNPTTNPKLENVIEEENKLDQNLFENSPVNIYDYKSINGNLLKGLL